MTSTKHKLAVILIAQLLSGCSSTQVDQPHVVTRPGVDIVAMPNDFRTILLSRDAQESFCLVPPPDGLLMTSENMRSGGDGQPGELSLSDSTDEKALGGRSSNVLIARELLYRACEFMRNHVPDTNQKMTLFEKTLDIVRDIAIGDDVSGTGSAE